MEKAQAVCLTTLIYHRNCALCAMLSCRLRPTVEVLQSHKCRWQVMRWREAGIGVSLQLQCTKPLCHVHSHYAGKTTTQGRGVLFRARHTCTSSCSFKLYRQGADAVERCAAQLRGSRGVRLPPWVRSGRSIGDPATLQGSCVLLLLYTSAVRQRLSP